MFWLMSTRGIHRHWNILMLKLEREQKKTETISWFGSKWANTRCVCVFAFWLLFLMPLWWYIPWFSCAGGGSVIVRPSLACWSLDCAGEVNIFFLNRWWTSNWTVVVVTCNRISHELLLITFTAACVLLYLLTVVMVAFWHYCLIGGYGC